MTTRTTTPMRTSGICPTCRLDVDLIKGKIKPHPEKGRPAGSRVLCLGGGQPPADPSAAAPPDGVDPTTEIIPTVFHDVTLDQQLLAEARPTGAWSGAEALSVDPKDLDPDPHNPRGPVHPDTVLELAEALVVKGMLQPIIVATSTTPGRYTIITGHRRHAAALRAGLPEVPVLLRRDLTPGSNTSLTAQIVENYHREPLLPIQEARTFAQLRDLGMKQTDIALACGCHQAQVSKRLALLKLDQDIAEQVGTDGGLDVHQAVELTKLPKPAAARALEAIKRGDDPRRAVGTARRDHERHAARTKAEDELEQAGIALVEPCWHWPVQREDRPLATGVDGEPQRYGGGARTIETTYADHHDQPCHGAALHDDLHVTYVCLDPTRHGYPSIAEAAEQAQAAAAAHAEELELTKASKAAASAGRRTAARDAALAKVPKADMANYTTAYLMCLLGDIDYQIPTVETVGQVLDWLELDRDPSGEEDAAQAADLATAVAAEGALRVGYMASVAAGMEILETVHDGAYGAGSFRGSPVLRNHLMILCALTGYEPTDADLEARDPIAAAPLPVPPDELIPALDAADHAELTDRGIVAWYAPTQEQVDGGDEARWVDAIEASAIADGGQDARLAYLQDDPSSSPAERTKAEDAYAPDREGVPA